MSEIELKFLIEEAASKGLWARAKASKLISGKPTTRMLKSIYLDTPEHALKQAGIALRLRRDGRRWIQTVKAGGQLHGGLSQVGEVENPAPGGRVDIHAIPDMAMRDKVFHCLNGASLRPVCETLIRRTAGEVSLEDGTCAELAVDIGEIRAEGRSARLAEAEIELLKGSPAKLFDIAQTLFPEGGLRFSRLSKAARGYLLSEKGHIDPPLAPRNAETVPLEAEQTAETAARDVLRECLDQVAENIAVVLKLDNVEGPHQLRVGLRRLRSAFSVFKPVLKSPEGDRLSSEARWLGQEVGRVRDLDVVAGEIVRREAVAHQDEPTLAALADALDAETAARRGELRALLAAARAQAFIIDLARFTEARGWLSPNDFEQTGRLAQPVAALAEKALGKRWKKARKLAADLETLDPQQRHELRKELKKLRYAVEFFGPLYPEKRIQPFLKRLKKLQTAFGDLNDATLVKTMFARDAASRLHEAGAERAVGWVVGASQARAEHSWTGAKSLWKDLEETKVFWR
ncbi:CHAD domain-containing protein [Mesorhizobium sp. BAC0120]|uniref:CYTH and CHAD domain-containing protein n=1 Tax=Mesorhizobium sp. BAC0120 TaxID=3090670 RepID=UPI00298CCA8B|nr:CHAD domain-containing protein [Mesorhizobium sp. BAC0120]MDW6026380.1 CHAD domain-containing protein [Mesorhizobium sp. BAC0120]